MNITKKKDGKNLTVVLEGRLDTTTAPELEASLKDDLDGINFLAFDLASLEYISSAGLRILLSAQKTMNKQGKMVVRNTNSTIDDIFEVTGFADILTVEK